MDFLLLFKALIMGVVEGITEFFPISSTGHLILVGDLINFDDGKDKVFEVVIQLGAILAVCWEYRHKLTEVITGLPRDPAAQKFALNILIGFLPAAIIGFLFIKTIKFYLFNAVAVASAFIIGGLIILWVESRPQAPRVHRVEDMTWRDALNVGLAQVLALIPGTSRSGATIMGGMLFGLDRRVATEFSFFLAIPIMFAATAYDVLKHWSLFSAADIPLFSVGFVSAFIAAFFTVRGLLHFVAHHTFAVFAWYRLLFGGLILLTWKMGWVSWAA